MNTQLQKSRFLGVRFIVALSLLFVACSMSAQSMSLVSTSVSYKEVGQSPQSAAASIPIYIGKGKITFGSLPLGLFSILERTKLSGDERNVRYRCKSASGTEFKVELRFSYKSEAEMTVANSNVEMVYKCTVANDKPYLCMVDLGLSCKWSISNYSTYPTDVVSAVFGAGKRLNYKEAFKLFGSGKKHLPTTAQIQELLTRCTWEFIDNPLDDNFMCYLVTGPNGNSIFLPCSDGGSGGYSSAWYLGANELDPYLTEALQLNFQSRVVYPFERQYFGCIRLVEDK